MKRTLCAVAVLSAVAGAAQARSNDAAAEPAPVYEVLRTGDKGLLVGVTEHAISVLGEMELQPYKAWQHRTEEVLPGAQESAHAHAVTRP